MHCSINPQEKLGHTITNIWHIKQFRTELSLSIFSVELKPAPNNMDIFEVEYIQQRKKNSNHPNTKGQTSKHQKTKERN
jgi:hypothetical protein